MAAVRFTCTSCSGTGKQRIPSTRTASERTCERCGGTGVLALEEVASHESFQLRPPVPRRLFFAAAAAAVAEPPRSSQVPEETAPAKPAPQNKAGKAASRETTPPVASASLRPNRNGPSAKSRAKSKSAESRKGRRKTAK